MNLIANLEISKNQKNPFEKNNLADEFTEEEII